MFDASRRKDRCKDCGKPPEAGKRRYPYHLATARKCARDRYAEKKAAMAMIDMRSTDMKDLDTEDPDKDDRSAEEINIIESNEVDTAANNNGINQDINMVGSTTLPSLSSTINNLYINDSEYAVDLPPITTLIPHEPSGCITQQYWKVIM